MRLLVLSIGVCILTLAAASAQTATKSGAQQLPVGQTFKNFEFPMYQNGQLKYSLASSQATGITQNRAEALDVKIQIYDNGVSTTTITSPKADLYVNDQKMRTKNTVSIKRSDMEASAQTCDFDLSTKKYLLRTNVKVILKNFDLNLNPGAKSTPAASTGTTSSDSSGSPVSVAPPQAPRRAPLDDSLLDTPGSISNTNSAPLPPTGTDNK